MQNIASKAITLAYVHQYTVTNVCSVMLLNYITGVLYTLHLQISIHTHTTL